MVLGADEVSEAVLRALRGEPATSGEIAASVGMTRQGLHRHLRQLLAQGLIQRNGAGRGTRYSLPYEFEHSYDPGTTREDQVWEDLRRAVAAIDELPENVLSILAYATTEWVNNALDHAAATSIRVRFRWLDGNAQIAVSDNGVGAFPHIRSRLGLEDDLHAAQELSKGKLTTDPGRHTGEGLFFSARALDVFILESGNVRFTVDTLRADAALGSIEPRTGTLVLGEVARDSTRTLEEVFAVHTDPETLGFDRSTIVVKLFAYGVRFISRSEAKRLVEGLDRFSRVVLDFQGVAEVGQGFADEVFRVWARNNPGTELIPVNMAPAVAFMVGRVERPAQGPTA